MSSLEESWRNMSDQALAAAAARADEYTPDAQQVIKAELQRRGMPEPPRRAQRDSSESISKPALPYRLVVAVWTILFFIATLAGVAYYAVNTQYAGSAPGVTYEHLLRGVTIGVVAATILAKRVARMLWKPKK